MTGVGLNVTLSKKRGNLNRRSMRGVRIGFNLNCSTSNNFNYFKKKKILYEAIFFRGVLFYKTRFWQIKLLKSEKK